MVPVFICQIYFSSSYDVEDFMVFIYQMKTYEIFTNVILKYCEENINQCDNMYQNTVIGFINTVSSVLVHIFIPQLSHHKDHPNEKHPPAVVSHLHDDFLLVN